MTTFFRTVPGRLRNVRRAIGAVLPDLLRDVAGIAGAAAISYGAWQVYRPAGWIVGGALAVAGAWLYRTQAEEPTQ